jgi:membrane associated rhomboid family serine protease
MFGNLLRNMTPVVKNLLIINVLMFLLTLAFGKDVFGGYDLNRTLGLYIFESPNFKPYQLITHMFMHGSFMHVFFNMFALVMFGSPLEKVWGSKRFLIYYLVTGFGAAFIQEGVSTWHLHQIMGDLSAYNVDWDMVKQAAALDLNTQMDQINAILNQVTAESGAGFGAIEKVFVQYIVPTVGASGAVFGILLGFGMLFPNTELVMLFFPVPIKAKYFVIFYGVLELGLGISNRPGDNIAHFAHVGGMIFGYILIKYWQKQDRTNLY